jgi:putrescine aminotransferase
MPMSRLWHSFADMSTVNAEAEVVIARGDGAWVSDEDGKRYLDAIASLWYCNVGHGRTELVDAAAAQMGTLAAYQTFSSFANRPAVELAGRLCELSPLPDPSVFFTNAGSDAVDTAAKLARRYWVTVGRPERTIIVAREHGYHGMNAYGTSLTGLPNLRDGYGGLVPGVIHVRHDDPTDFAAVLEEKGDQIAAFIGEPVIGGGGVYPPPAGYWETVSQLCSDHDVLLIADEVITAFGRVGSWFGSDRFGITPDIITCAKGVTSGYVPLGAVLCGSRVREPFWDGTGVFWQGYTYAGHPTACAVGLRNLELLESEDLLARVRGLEPVFAEKLGELVAHPLVAECRTIGLMGGVELSDEAVSADATAAQRVVALALERGVILRAIAGRVLQVSPPFVITEEEISLLAGTIDEALHEYAIAAPMV